MITGLSHELGSGVTYTLLRGAVLRSNADESGEVIYVHLDAVTDAKIVAGDVPERAGGGGGFFGVDVGGLVLGSAGGYTLPEQGAVVNMTFRDGEVLSFKIDRDELGPVLAVVQRIIANPPADASTKAITTQKIKNPPPPLSEIYALLFGALILATIAGGALQWMMQNFCSGFDVGTACDTQSQIGISVSRLMPIVRVAAGIGAAVSVVCAYAIMMKRVVYMGIPHNDEA